LGAESETKFFNNEVWLRLEFTLDAAGRVTGYDGMMPDGNVEHRTRLDEPLPKERAAIEVDPKVLEHYVGKYELEPGFVLTVTREGNHLFTQATGQPRVEVFASSQNEFFLKVVDAQLSFHVDKNGHADGVVLHQGGHDVTAKRVH